MDYNFRDSVKVIIQVKSKGTIYCFGVTGVGVYVNLIFVWHFNVTFG